MKQRDLLKTPVMTTFAVTATRSKGWWAIHADVPGAIVWTQSRRLDQVDGIAREAIALALDIPEDSFELEVTSVLEERLRAQIDAAIGLSKIADETQQAATRLNQVVARNLKEAGMSVRDSGTLMDVSSQRISQLIAQQLTLSEGVPDQIRSITALMDGVKAQLDPTITATRVLKEESAAQPAEAAPRQTRPATVKAKGAAPRAGRATRRAKAS
jgi:plasmid maintenance system antidote protein VapI